MVKQPLAFNAIEELWREYPSCNIFIASYAEKSFLEILKSADNEKSYYNSALDFKNIPSPYLIPSLNIK